MGEFININAMDEAIAEYKKDHKEAVEKKLLEMLAEIVNTYKKENPQGEFLSLAYVDGTLMVSNEYYLADAEFPINAYISGETGKFFSRVYRMNSEEEPDDDE